MERQNNRQLEPSEPWPNGRKGDPLEGASALFRPGIGPLDAVRVRGAGTAERRSLAFEDSIRAEACETFRLVLYWTIIYSPYNTSAGQRRRAFHSLPFRG
jgi:hypothetical protein